MIRTALSSPRLRSIEIKKAEDAQSVRSVVFQDDSAIERDKLIETPHRFTDGYGSENRLSRFAVIKLRFRLPSPETVSVKELAGFFDRALGEIGFKEFRRDVRSFGDGFGQLLQAAVKINIRGI